MTIKDRKGERMIVRSHCVLCYSEILSEKPVFLADKRWPAMHARLELTTETPEEVQELWSAIQEKRLPDFPVQTGHWDKGVD